MESFQRNQTLNWKFGPRKQGIINIQQQSEVGDWTEMWVLRKKSICKTIAQLLCPASWVLHPAVAKSGGSYKEDFRIRQPMPPKQGRTSVVGLRIHSFFCRQKTQGTGPWPRTVRLSLREPEKSWGFPEVSSSNSETIIPQNRFKGIVENKKQEAFMMNSLSCMLCV